MWEVILKQGGDSMNKIIRFTMAFLILTAGTAFA